MDVVGVMIGWMSGCEEEGVEMPVHSSSSSREGFDPAGVNALSRDLRS